jgi:hypothetical protein
LTKLQRGVGCSGTRKGRKLMEDGTDREREACSRICGKAEVPSEEELRVLKAMRSMKERVRDIRTRLFEISSAAGSEKAGEKETLEKELEKLKSEWESLEQERKNAAHMRMVLLGHEEPSPGQ